MGEHPEVEQRAGGGVDPPPMRPRRTHRKERRDRLENGAQATLQPCAVLGADDIVEALQHPGRQPRQGGQVGVQALQSPHEGPALGQRHGLAERDEGERGMFPRPRHGERAGREVGLDRRQVEPVDGAGV